jgi:predicted DNA-binding antitoxin AbrB/MazE fold protein
MNQEVHAIYEHGVLRPLEALDLPEATEVVVTLREARMATPQRGATDPLLGLMADEPELVDDVVAAAMTARQKHPLRTDG